MKPTRNQIDSLFEQAVSDIRAQQADATTVETAKARVMTRLAGSTADVVTAEVAPTGQIRNCEDMQALIPAYRADRLSEARKMLFEDHMSECIPCRKALKSFSAAPRNEQRRKDMAPVAAWWQQPAWTAAAGLMIGVTILGYLWLRNAPTVSADPVTVESVEGGLYRLVGDRSVPVAAGEKVSDYKSLRTGKGARARIRLGDGSLIELKERTELSVQSGRDGRTVNLNRGNVILEAAKQHGHLYVKTDDSEVSVKGTIFSVNAGVKGSRVSVVEGEVQVNSAKEKALLHSGEQVTTSTAVDRVPVAQEVAWSQDSDKYQRLLVALTGLENDLRTKTVHPGIRYQSSLIDRLPADTVFVASLPNLAETIRSSNRIIQERLQSNPELRTWWEQRRGKGEDLNGTLEQLSSMLDLFGDEIVISIANDKSADAPLILAQAKNPGTFRADFTSRIAGLNTSGKTAPTVRFVDGSAPAAGGKDEITVLTQGDLVAIVPGNTAQRIAIGGGFTQTAFGASINEHYKDGVSAFIAADLQKVIAKETAKTEPKSEDAAWAKLGLGSLKYFVADWKEVNGQSQSSAMVRFDESNHGIGSWLAAPGSMGALDFVSPDASLVTAFVIKNPSALTDDILSAIETTEPNFRAKLAQLQSVHGIDVRSDFAATLGGEFTVALDGPVLPSPSWKLVVEVYDTARLQQSLERAVTEVNKLLAAEGKPQIQFEHVEANGRTYHRLTTPNAPVEVNYTFADGYLIAAPSRALIDQAIAGKANGTTLVHSQRFIAALPTDGNTSFSALFYQNLTPMLEKAPTAMKGKGKLNLGAISSRIPTLAFANAYPDRIVFGCKGGTMFSPADLFGIGPLALKAE